MVLKNTTLKSEVLPVIVQLNQLVKRLAIILLSTYVLFLEFGQLHLD